ncbi:hypothetical protein DFQ29_002975 [Apophysomyces sp. BC1021]|nr:hypothetical protein DFQ29_002975 [Apophysomyces sp. BC1021]
MAMCIGMQGTGIVVGSKVTHNAEARKSENVINNNLPVTMTNEHNIAQRTQNKDVQAAFAIALQSKSQTQYLEHWTIFSRESIDNRYAHGFPINYDNSCIAGAARAPAATG